MSKKINIAIDGPAGAGKSTVAKLVAQRLGFSYIDTGAMYRALTLKALEEGTDVFDEASLLELAKNFNIRFVSEGHVNRVFMDGKDVTNDIRSSEVSSNVSHVAKVPAVREKLSGLQRDMAGSGGVVMEGRDIGTAVLADAEKKFFLDAGIEERVLRRQKELEQKGLTISKEEVFKDISKRDFIDSSREAAPLRVAPGAIIIDSSHMTIDEVVDTIIDVVYGRI